jgi:single-strand DNA-binding protein
MKNLANSVQLIGRLGMDPVISTVGKDKAMARVSIAIDASYKNAKGEKIQDTQWHALVAWGSTATFASKYLKKGQEVAVEGRLVTRSYETPEGEKRYITEVHVGSFLMVGGKAKAA